MSAVPFLSSTEVAMFSATIVLFVLVALPIVSLWFAVDSREHDARVRQW